MIMGTYRRAWETTDGRSGGDDVVFSETTTVKTTTTMIVYGLQRQTIAMDIRSAILLDMLLLCCCP